MNWMQPWRNAVHKLKREVHALYLACKDRRTPWYVKTIAAVVTAYALSPIDLIPDPIPVLGLLDDLLLLPIGIWLAVRLIPPDVMVDCRRRAEQADEKPTSRWMAVIIVSIWLLTLASTIWFFTFYFQT